MSNQGVKQCQANEGADNKAGNVVQCARGRGGAGGISWTCFAKIRGLLSRSVTLVVLRVRNCPGVACVCVTGEIA